MSRTVLLNERAGKELQNKARALMLQANIPMEYWPKAHRAVACLLNRTPSKRRGYQTPPGVYSALLRAALSIP